MGKKGSSSYAPSDKDMYMDAKQIQYFKKKLMAWRSALEEGAECKLESFMTKQWKQSDVNDQASDEMSLSLEMRSDERSRKLISKIDEALIRIQNGTYGICEETGEEIGIKRLEARPIATLCIEAQERHEKTESSYSEEEES